MARGYGKGGNSSGRGPVGKAPASRAPIKAAVTPKAGASRNPGSSAPVRTGGGEGSAKHIMRTPSGGSPSTRKTSPDAVSNLGRVVGNHAMDSGGKNLQRPGVPLHQPMPALGGRLGNDVSYSEAATANRGCVGVGRTVHRSGGQAHYDNPANHPGTINTDRSISPPGSNQGSPVPTRPMGQPSGGGGPGGFGFSGKGK